MDETESIRAVIARSFAILGASVHAKDPIDQIDIAEEFEHWIMTGERMGEYFDPDTVGMLDRCTASWKPKKTGTK